MRSKADPDSGRHLATGEAHNRDVVGTLVCHIRGISVGADGDPVWRFAHSYGATDSTARGVRNLQLARVLTDDQPGLPIGRKQTLVGLALRRTMKSLFARPLVLSAARVRSNQLWPFFIVFKSESRYKAIGLVFHYWEIEKHLY